MPASLGRDGRKASIHLHAFERVGYFVPRRRVSFGWCHSQSSEWLEPKESATRLLPADIEKAMCMAMSTAVPIWITTILLSMVLALRLASWLRQRQMADMCEYCFGSLRCGCATCRDVKISNAGNRRSVLGRCQHCK